MSLRLRQVSLAAVVVMLAGCASVNRTTYYEQGMKHLANGNFEAAYRFFEDPTRGSEAEVEKLMKSNPQLVQAGFQTFSTAALASSAAKYGPVQAYSIEKHRVERFRIYANADDYQTATTNIERQFSQQIAHDAEEKQEREWVAKLPDEEQAKYLEKKLQNKRSLDTITGIVIDAQVSNESQINSGAGSQLGASYGEAAYLDSTNWRKYKATSQLNAAVAGAIIGGLLDKPTVIQFRTTYFIRTASGDVKRIEQTSAKATHIPIGVCVDFREQFNILEIVNQNKCLVGRPNAP